MMTRAHILISGRVQGVFFRSATRVKARDLGVTGWVRNLQDGRVEAVFEGATEPVEQLLSFCKRGPPDALVQDCAVRWETFTGDYRDFTVISQGASPFEAQDR